MSAELHQERFGFQTEVVLGLMVHSLYGNLITGGRALIANTSPLFPFSMDAERMAAASPARRR